MRRVFADTLYWLAIFLPGDAWADAARSSSPNWAWALFLPRALSDNLDVTAVVDAIPLARDAQGAYRVGGTRVTLDLVVRAFNRGATAEEIVQKYDVLQLSDVYQVIGYYLKHADELAEYFANRVREEDGLLSSHPEWAPVGLRDRLLARRKPR